MNRQKLQDWLLDLRQHYSKSREIIQLLCGFNDCWIEGYIHRALHLIITAETQRETSLMDANMGVQAKSRDQKCSVPSFNFTGYASLMKCLTCIDITSCQCLEYETVPPFIWNEVNSLSPLSLAQRWSPSTINSPKNWDWCQFLIKLGKEHLLFLSLLISVQNGMNPCASLIKI